MLQLAELMKGKSYPDSGKILYEILFDAICNSKVVEINMSGVDALPSMFLNVSFGPLIKEKGLNVLKKSFKLFNVSQSQVERIKRYFEDYSFGVRQ